MSTDLARHIELEASFNFRDLGGYLGLDGRAVRWERLYRADGLYRLTPADAGRVAELGIVTLIDLRTQTELDERGRAPEWDHGVRYHHLPMFDILPDPTEWEAVQTPAHMADRYRGMLEEGRASVAAALRLLGQEESYPAVFHCAAGKDRTGIVAALVLGLLGVSATEIVADYALSGAAMTRFIAWFREANPDVEFPVASPMMASAPAETMVAFLGLITKEFGGFEAVTTWLGVEPATIAGLRAALLSS